MPIGLLFGLVGAPAILACWSLNILNITPAWKNIQLAYRPFTAVVESARVHIPVRLSVQRPLEVL